MARLPIALQDGGANAAQRVGTGAVPAVNMVTVGSFSSSVTETVNGSHHFTINGYSLAKGMGVGKYITSDTFSVGGYQWAIYFYPDGKNAEDNSLYVSVFIALASEGTDVRALFELTLLDQSGKGKHKVHSHFDRSLESGPYTLKYRGSMWGYKRFFRRAVLETSDFLKSDSLAISCTVGVVVSSTQGPKNHCINVPKSDLGLRFGELLESGEATDVKFEVEGETFHAHKLVLAARSPVLKAKLLGPVHEQKMDVIHVEDMKASVFKAMLHFIYTDSAFDSDEADDAESAESTFAMMPQHLLAAADRYGLDRLRSLCESRLCEEVSVLTVAKILALAEQHHSSQLKAVCLKFAAANLAAVMMSDGYEYLRESCPALQSELLEAVAGVDEEAGVGIPTVVNRRPTVWAPGLDGSDVNGRRVRQKM